MSDNRNNLELRRNRYALRLLTAVLFVTPVAMAQAPAGSAAQSSNLADGQSQARAAKPQPASSPESAAQTPTAASSKAEPQMQDQSAPPTESLGDAARKARTQKTKDATPKVYTEDAVSQLSGHGVSVVGDGSSGSGGASSGTEGSHSNSTAQSSAGSQEQMWRSRSRAIHDQMAQLDQRISGIKDEIAKYGAVQVDPQSGAQAGVIYIKDRNAEIERIEEQKTALQGQMDALEEEGRKAGADSGWFR
jgi:transcription initiation factor TFIID subunit TAF12